MDGIIAAGVTGGLSLIGVIITVVLSYKSTQKQISDNNELMLYRLQQLENKQDKHNSLIERVYKLEESERLHDEKIKVANHRIEDLEKYHKAAVNS